VFSVDRKVFPLTGKCFPLTGKCFLLTNFSNGKQTQESLESDFPESEFRETNMALASSLTLSRAINYNFIMHLAMLKGFPKHNCFTELENIFTNGV